MNWNPLRCGVTAALSAVGSALAAALGGWDSALETLVWCMAADYLTGLVVAGVFHRSGKSTTGTLDSRAGFLGLVRKGAELLLVLVANRLDGVLGDGTYARTAVILFFTANESLSILENLGLMGVTYPSFLQAALEVLRTQEDQKRGKS